MSGLGRLRSSVHDPDAARACVHLLELPPERLLLGRDGLARLNFQPRICRGAVPCIASRTGDVLTLAFDEYGPATEKSHRAYPLTLRWRYQLQPTDDPRVVLAVQMVETLRAVANA